MPALTGDRSFDDDAVLFELFEPFVQNRGRYPGHSLLQCREAIAAQKKFPNDQQRPAIAQNLGRFCDRTELAVFAHDEA